MKTISPKTPESGPKYWRSLDELAGSPNFEPWLHREFPQGASEWSDPQSRREFVKVMGASLLLGGLATGCRRPVEHIEPYTKLPDGYIHGVAQYYATSMSTRSGALPLVVRASEGRPVKIEGNAQVPDWNGGTNLQTQASILDLYDPDRSTRFLRDGASVERVQALNYLNTLSSTFAQSRGAGLAILADRNSSPSRLRLQKAILQKYPQAKWHVYEAGDLPTGNGVRPVYHFEKAERILSLDCDFVGGEDESARHCRGFAQGRKIAKPGDPMNRLYVVESLMTLTGAAADHRLRRAPSQIPQIAQQLAQAIVSGTAGGDAWIAECAKDLLAHKGKALVVAGYRQSPAVHALAHAMNSALGADGQTVTWMPLAEVAEASLETLVQSLNAGQVDTLVILGGNPAYNAPADLNWAAAQKKAKQSIRVGYYEDETTALSNWHFAEAHYLESWGDTRSADGRVFPVQPLIAPLFGGVTQLEVLARLAGEQETDAHTIARRTFAQLANNQSEDAWKKFLHDGYLPEVDVKPRASGLNAAQLLQNASGQIKTAQPASKDNLEVVIYRCAKLEDGRYSNNAWLMEMPDTITKLSWDNALFLSKKTADDLGISFAVLKPKKADASGLDVDHRETAENMVPIATLTVNGQKVEGPVWVMPGLADNTVAVAMGYGRTKGRIARGVGFNANVLRTSASPFLALGGKLAVTDRTHRLAMAQEHWAMEGRPIVREANYELFQKTPNFARALNLEDPPDVPGHKGPMPLYPNPLDAVKGKALHQWGMSIDLNSCTGCGACVIACQSENNVPVVGKRQLANGREMHWLRIDRYFTGSVAEPQAVTQPMLCQHCESAPCENVCPVNATVHDQEGLNVMAYNRCVGTRYCSNNCPYKVRRFNYFDYNKRDMVGQREYASPLTSTVDGEWEVLRWFKNVDKPVKDQNEWELLKLVKNPDVSVRMRGVMEKCTYCTQRIEGAKIAQKVKAKTSGDVVVPDGAFTTACAQACPTEAIVFGNIADPNSKVAKIKAQDRTYGVLEFLLTKPRTSYLARVRNPNPAMPDHKEFPASTKEYIDYMHSNPYDPHAHGGASGAHGAHGAVADPHKAPTAGAAKGGH